MLKINDQLPHFSLKNQYGDLISLEDFQWKKIILFCYPKASTPACSTEACNLNSGYEELKNLGYEVLGISADNQQRQLKFSNKNHFSFSLLCDEEKAFLKSLGVWRLKKMMGIEYEGIVRTTFITDEHHKITHIVEKVNTKDHTNQIISLISEEKK